MDTHRKPPVGWGEDLLSCFQATAILNEYSSFVHHSDWQKLLLDIAADLDKCSQFALDNTPIVADPSALLLFATAHNQYLGTVRLAASGQSLAAYPVSRAAVESAVYGWYVSRDSNIASRWSNKPRQDEREALRAWSNEFKFSALCRRLKSTAPNEANWAHELHQSAIDMGGHPNKNALYSNMRTVKTDCNKKVLQMQFLHQWDISAVAVMKLAAETGMFVLRLFPMAFPRAELSPSIDANASILVRSLMKLKTAATLDLSSA